MPIYEYRCDQGHTFEVMQRISDDPVERCRTCEAPVRRVFHPVAVHFKGSGFYNTDYGKQRRRGEGEGEGGGADGAKPDSGSSEAKGEKSSDGDAKGAGKESSSDAKAASGSSSSSS